jgi:hypothetical protein
MLFLSSSRHFCPKSSEVGFLENCGFETNRRDSFFVLTIYDYRVSNSLQNETSSMSYISSNEGQSPFFLLPRSSKTKKRSLTFIRTDIAQPKDVVESSEASHFVENCLLYNHKLLKQKSCHDDWSQSRGFLENLLPRILDKSVR